jgi:hypothetical protein
MNHPKKQPSELASKGEPISEQGRISHRFLDLLQAPFGFAFWRLEQAKARIHDRAANIASDQ